MLLIFVGSEATDALTSFSVEHKVNPKVLKNTNKGVLYFFTEALKKNMAPVHVKEDLILLGV